MQQIIIHVDMDAFYASVEIRDDPALRGKPLIIGSLPQERGVVATCSYEARKYGVHSGMNIKDAFRLCPGGIFMHPDFEKYKAVSDRLHEIWNTYASAAETIALDEAYLDVTESAVDADGARRIAQAIRKRTREELGLTCSVGVAYSKTAAKTASEERKPDGYFEILTPKDFVDLVIDRDVRVLYTVGNKTAEKLNAAGFFKVRDIREHPEEVVRLLGKHGTLLTQMAFGIDERKVTPYRPEDAKSVSRELTFQEDVEDFELLKDVLFLLALSVEDRVRRRGLHGKGISLKLTYHDMRSITRSKAVSHADSAVTIWEEAAKLLDQVEQEPIRLVGTGVYNLEKEEGRQLSFEDVFRDTADDPSEKIREKLKELNGKYGLSLSGPYAEMFRHETMHQTAEKMRKMLPNR